MKRVLLSLFLMLAFASCVKGEDESTVLPDDFAAEMLDTKFTAAVIDDVSPADDGGLYAVSMTFSNNSETSLAMVASTALNYLESGYYEIENPAGKRLEASVTLKYGKAAVDVTGGEVYVRRTNSVYYLRWTLQTAYGEIVCVAEDVGMAFEMEQFEKLSEGGNCIIKRDLTLESTYMNSTMKYSVCLPEKYDPGKEYPVLYILHGMDGNNNDWFKNGASGGVIGAYASEFFKNGGQEMIIVSPEGRNLFYVDGYEPGQNYMSYFFKEFIPYIEKEYPILAGRGSRAIAGLSMGGYGALYYAMLHPEMFCHVYACSAAVNGNGSSTPWIYYSFISARKRGEIKDLPEITLEIGTEDFLYRDNENWVKNILNLYDVSYEYITRPGVHYWSFWNGCSPRIIMKSAAAFD